MVKGINIEKTLNKIVSYALLISAIGLILFMFIQSFVGIVQFATGIVGVFENNFHETAMLWLQSVATVVILVKAYKVLMSYMKNHHLSIKYLLEINFTATSLELLFNESSYSLEMKIIFLILGLSSLLIYVLFNKQIMEVENNVVK